MFKNNPEKQSDLFQNPVHRDLYIAIGRKEFSSVRLQLKTLLEKPSREVLILAVLAVVSNPDESLERITWAMNMWPILGLLTLYDPQEDDPEKQVLIKAAEVEAAEILAEEPKHLGFCHMAWGTQKHILKEKYGMDWRTPAEMNPGWFFD